MVDQPLSMLRILIVLFIVCWPALTYSQSNWGFCAGQVKHWSNDSVFTSTCYISKVKNLATLKCEKSDDFADPEFTPGQKYAKCLCDWFYSEISQTDARDVPLEYGRNMAAEVELYSLSTMHPERPESWQQSVFMDKKTASERRKQYIGIAQQIHATIVYVK